MKPLWLFLFSTRENWVVVFASKGNNGNVACHIDKERENHLDEKMWKDGKIQEKKKMVHDEYLWVF
jgi:hypothetical protein